MLGWVSGLALRLLQDLGSEELEHNLLKVSKSKDNTYGEEERGSFHSGQIVEIDFLENSNLLI